MKRVLIVLFIIFLVACVPEEAIDNTELTIEDRFDIQDIESEPTVEKEGTLEFVENISSDLEVEVVSIEKVSEEDLVNSKTVKIRIKDAVQDLHKEGSSQRIRDNFPDIVEVFVHSPTDSFYPEDILPFRYMYSKEANKTFNLCAVERTVFICDGLVDSEVSEKELNNICTVTAEYVDG